VFVVLVLASAFLAGTPPKLSDSDAKIANFFKDNQDALKIGSYLGGLAGLVFLWFLGSLFGRLRRAEGGSGRLAGVTLTGGVVGVAVNFVFGGLLAYAALHAADKVSPAPLLYRLASDLGAYINFAIAVFVAGVSVLIWTKNVLPKWIGYAGEALALLFLVAAAGVSSESDTIFTIGFVAFIAFAVWLVIVSVMLYLKPETA
jgi:hypothetical protein